MNIKKSLTEFVGTLIFLFVIISTGNMWAIIITLGLLIHFLGKVSGANFNPAVTIMMVINKSEPLSDLFPYIMAQVAGAIAAVEIYRFLKREKILV